MVAIIFMMYCCGIRNMENSFSSCQQASKSMSHCSNVEFSIKVYLLEERASILPSMILQIICH
jgi:hypothetical protein